MMLGQAFALHSACAIFNILRQTDINLGEKEGFSENCHMPYQ